MSEREDYIAGQKACGIEVGDTVQVVRKAKNREGGWLASWVSSMDDTVGENMEVNKIHSGRGGLQLRNSHFSRDYPYFVLEIVKKKDGSVPKSDIKEHCEGCKHLNTDVCVDCMALDGSCTWHTRNPPCSYCTDSLCKEKTQGSINTRVLVDKFAEITNTSRKESNMSTQEQTVFDVTVIERTEVLHEGSGIVQKINRTVLHDKKVSAVSEEAAKQKALASCKVTNFDNLEITCRPF